MREGWMPPRLDSRPVALVLVTAAALLCSLSVAPGTSPAALGHKQGKARKASAPVSGIYDACAYSDPLNMPLANCDDRLRAVRRGGFDVVLNYWSAAMSIDENLAYASKAASLGMQVIWNLSNYRDYPLDQKLELVGATASHRATWGYYIGDEVRPEDRAPVAQLSTAVRSITRKPLMFVSRPNRSLLKPFRKLADYVGPDSYPHGPFDPPTCRTARWASKLAPRNPLLVLQAFSWSIDYPNLQPQWPSARQIRGMRNAATRCGDPKLLMWFCFHCITAYHPHPDAYWRRLVWAANGRRLGPKYRFSSIAL
jgi:hypothetical protein